MDASCTIPPSAVGPRTARPFLPAGCRDDGFTLIEMMTTLAVLLVLLVIGAVSFSSALKSNRLYSVQSEIAASLALARSESALRGVPVVLVANSSTSGNEFGGGWTVYADLNSNGSFDAGEPELRKQEALPSDIVAKTGAETSVTFSPSGFLVPVTAITVQICKSTATSDNVTEYALTVQPNGMTDVSPITCP
jgi:type IV fimbrial biogenesis protein FimT